MAVLGSAGLADGAAVFPGAELASVTTPPLDPAVPVHAAMTLAVTRPAIAKRPNEAVANWRSRAPARQRFMTVSHTGPLERTALRTSTRCRALSF
jgi:hypothetical protein